MADMEDALNRLCKWRSVLAGWHLGTMTADRPGVQAMRDLQDFRLITRAELTALAALLIVKGVFSEQEWRDAVATEALALDAAMERKFPGYSTFDDGVRIDPARAVETNKRLGFPD